MTMHDGQHLWPGWPEGYARSQPGPRPLQTGGGKVARMHLQLHGVWRGRGHVRLRWRARAAAPTYYRLRRRSPVDHKVVRLRRLEVWW